MIKYTIAAAEVEYLRGEHVGFIADKLGVSIDEVRALAVGWRAATTFRGALLGADAITRPQPKDKRYD